MTDDELMEAFEAGRMPPDGFPHRAHVRMAWIYLRRHALEVAMARFSSALRRFAAAQGEPGRYHETITVAYVVLIHDRMAGTGAANWNAFAAEHADLLVWKPSILDTYYSPDILWSDRARDSFLPPDRAPLPRARDEGGPEGPPLRRPSLYDARHGNPFHEGAGEI